MLLTIRNYLLAAVLLSLPAITSGQQSQPGPGGALPAGMGLTSASDVPGTTNIETLPMPHAVRPMMAPEVALAMFESHAPRQKSELKSYTDETLVMAELPESSQRGALELESSYTAPHSLRFKPIRYSGDAFVKTNVIARILQSEVDYAAKDDAERTALTAANYKFS